VVLQAKGRISIRKDGKYFLYLPKSVVEDSAFPFKVELSVPVEVIIDSAGKKLLITHLKRSKQAPRKMH
jgi:hypothetical protein